MKKIYVIGLGPGGYQYMTEQAKLAIEESEVITGYTVYVKLIEELCEGKTDVKRLLSMPFQENLLQWCAVVMQVYMEWQELCTKSVKLILKLIFRSSRV